MDKNIYNKKPTLSMQTIISHIKSLYIIIITLLHEFVKGVYYTALCSTTVAAVN